MLIKCNECQLQVSDKAISCPHCGYPINSTTVTVKKSNKRRRLPNGFGEISKINNKNLRNPYRAMICVGKRDDGKIIVKTLKPKAYFATYNEAYEAIVEYHKNPYDLDDDISVSELYSKWIDEYFQKLKSESSHRTITSAWVYCKSVYNMRAKDIRSRHIKGCMDEATSPNTKSRIKSIFNLMLDYALENEIVDKNYARTFNISENIITDCNDNKKKHIAFTDEEFKTLLENINEPFVDVVVFQCFTGWRPQELGLLKLENINFENWTITGGMKTKAGTNRIVPIHPAIRELVKKFYNYAKEIDSEYLINCDIRTNRSSIFMSYDKYNKRFKSIMIQLKLNPEHRSHDPRVHFVTMAKKYNVDEYAIKYIIGHSITDLTENTYTERKISWLESEMKKIYSPWQFCDVGTEV